MLNSVRADCLALESFTHLRYFPLVFCFCHVPVFSYKEKKKTPHGLIMQSFTVPAALYLILLFAVHGADKEMRLSRGNIKLLIAKAFVVAGSFSGGVYV